MSSVVPKGALVSAAPIATPSIWNSTEATPTLSPAVALIVIEPVGPAARFAGAVRAIVDAVVSAPIGVMPLSPPPPPPHAARIATPLAVRAWRRSPC